MLSCTFAFLRRGGQNTRHSRAGGNPEKAAEYWIPACAGMTGAGTVGDGGFHRVALLVINQGINSVATGDTKLQSNHRDTKKND
jgi:hypothetical protein